MTAAHDTEGMCHMQLNPVGPAQPGAPVWKVTTLDGRAYTLPYWQYLNSAAAVPFGSTIVLQPGQTLVWPLPAQGCAPAFTGWWTTINIGGPQEPANR